MKSLSKKFSAALLLFAVLFSGFAMAQNITGKSVKIDVSGTSPMHDWTMSSNSGTFSATVNGNIINNVKFSTAAKALKSTKGKMMDGKAYEALKADKNPNISFAASSLNIGKSTLIGKLTIAGKTKDVSIPVTVTKKGTSYHITGTEAVALSAYGMERPGFMGVRTGDGVTVTVNIVAN